MPKWIELWPEFEADLKSRLQAGYAHYGDWSFDRPLGGPEGLLKMVEEELMDVVGWAFILQARIRHLRKLVEEQGKL